jgi:hypothetical protein
MRSGFATHPGAALRVHELPGHRVIRSGDADLAAGEVDVVPPEREEFAEPQAAVEGDGPAAAVPPVDPIPIRAQLKR